MLWDAYASESLLGHPVDSYDKLFKFDQKYSSKEVR